MTDPRNPSDPESPREGASPSDQWTWQRPADGSPVYGDEGSRQEPPPLPPEADPHGAPPSPGAIPGVGPAQPGGHQYGEPGYQQPPPPESYPPEQWPPYGAAQGQYGGPPQQGPPAGYGGGFDPNYMPPMPPKSGVNKGMFSLFTGLFSVFVGFCCCPPVGILGGIVGIILGWSGMQEAKVTGQPNTAAIWGFWLSIAAILLALLNIIVSIIIQVFYPEMYADMLRDLGLG